MCHFISWLYDKNTGINQWLNNRDVFETKRGLELQKHCGNAQDFVGHGAVEFYYGIKAEKLEHKECTDFSTPENFPAEIAEEIKKGLFSRLGVPGGGLLTKKASDEYDKVHKAAEAEYHKVRNAAWAEYNKACDAAEAKCNKVCDDAKAEYYKVCDAAWDERNKACNAAQAECDKVYNAAQAEYDKVCRESFWGLFADPKNRVKAWR